MKKWLSIVGVGLIAFSSLVCAQDKVNLRSVYNMMDDKQYEKAAHKLQGLVKQYPKDADVRYQFGLSLLRMHKFKEAINVYKETINTM